MQRIYKRDGNQEEFKPYKIEDAIKKAFDSVNIKYDDRVYANVLARMQSDGLKAVEEIQDVIEHELYNAGYFGAMKSFMLYRHTHKLQREHIMGLNSDTTYISSMC